MALWTPANLGSAFAMGYRLMDTAGANPGAEVTQSSGAVSVWNDWSGNARHLAQATPASQPTYSATSFPGSKPGVTFDGTSDFILRASTAILPSGTALNAFIVASLAADTAPSGRVVSFAAAGQEDWPGTGWVALYTPGTDTTTLQAYDSGLLSSRPITAGNPFIAASVRDGTNHILAVDGTPGTPVAHTFSTFSIDNFTVFGQAGGYDVAKGVVAEIVITTGVMTVAVRESVEGYLAWKWGLQGNLPVGHTYKSAAPTTVDAALATTDRPDVAAVTASFGFAASLATTDRPDVTAASVTIENQAQLATTDRPDVAAITAASGTPVQLAAVDLPDTAAFTASLNLLTSLATTDRPDTAAVTAVFLDVIAASVSVTDRPDAAAVNIALLGIMAVQMAATEAPDVVHAAGHTYPWHSVPRPGGVWTPVTPPY